MSNKKYGWKPDVPDQRDFYKLAFKTSEAALPDSVDLRPGFEAPYDQGALGSCSANATGAAIQYCRKKQQEIDFMPSRLFIYWDTRAIEGTTAYDSGGTIRDSVKSVNKLGVCPETTWPYNINKFTTKPTAHAYKQALLCQSLNYERVNQVQTDMCQCLADGFPIVLGFSVYESFENDQMAKTGVGQMPGPKEKLLGGHAVVCVGYNLKQGTWLLRNSWGKKWGMKGYFTFPVQYLLATDLASDFWAITLTE